MQTIDKKIKESSQTIEILSNIISKEFYGQKKIVEQVLTCILSSGNALLIGVPGLGKTLLFQTISDCMNLKSNRIQCTPDLMPSDILGTEILSKKDNQSFTFIKGPIFCQLLMIDEINRASPRTQSAFLQAMQEGNISVGGKNINLPKPFIVLATQNPIEQEGTYNLPEAQLDRFLMQIDIEYPDQDTEKLILENSTNNNKNTSSFSNNDLNKTIELIEKISVGESVLDYVLRLIRNLRPETSNFDFIKKYVRWGPGPRGGLALIQSSKARSVLRKNYSPTISDIINLAKPTLRHRISLNFEARSEQIKIDQLIEKVCNELD